MPKSTIEPLCSVNSGIERGDGGDDVGLRSRHAVSGSRRLWWGWACRGWTERLDLFGSDDARDIAGRT
jgi:hypothetical protein